MSFDEDEAVEEATGGEAETTAANVLESVKADLTRQGFEVVDGAARGARADLIARMTDDHSLVVECTARDQPLDEHRAVLERILGRVDGASWGMLTNGTTYQLFEYVSGPRLGAVIFNVAEGPWETLLVEDGSHPPFDPETFARLHRLAHDVLEVDADTRKQWSQTALRHVTTLDHAYGLADHLSERSTPVDDLHRFFLETATSAPDNVTRSVETLRDIAADAADVLDDETIRALWEDPAIASFEFEMPDIEALLVGDAPRAASLLQSGVAPSQLTLPAPCSTILRTHAAFLEYSHDAYLDLLDDRGFRTDGGTVEISTLMGLTVKSACGLSLLVLGAHQSSPGLIITGVALLADAFVDFPEHLFVTDPR